MQVKTLKDTNVVLISGGGKIYTDIAARFVRSERPIEELLASPYDAKIVDNILSSGHLAAVEFDYFLFGVEGFSRVTETQLVRKRLASYLIKSGRIELKGRRVFDVFLPESVKGHFVYDYNGNSWNACQILSLIEDWYNEGLKQDVPEEDLRYMKPQGTTFKAIIGMNAHALLDWFKIRCCKNAQTEIRYMATNMLRLCKKAAPDLFRTAGASCISLGYCPENKYQNAACIGSVHTHQSMLIMMRFLDSYVKKHGEQYIVEALDNYASVIQKHAI